ncbi:MAG: hypothetical protein QOF67_906, partial [Mycobacterium sp.]|nr:hypothetical protein [Mycobacterium sp.]
MTAGSRSFKPKEFLDKLGKDQLDGPLTLTGMVKASEDSSTELMFAVGTRCGNWTSVPTDIIESIDVLGSVPCDDHSHHRVTLTFKTPKSLEAATFAALLSAAVKQRGQAKRVVRKNKGGGSGSPQTFAGGCGCSDYEIDADGTVWQLTDVVDFEDGSCICTYMHA